MKLFSIILTIAAFLFLSTTSRAQDENIRGIVRTANGVLVVWNEPGNNFTLEVKGKNFEPIQNKNVAFLLDGKFLQIVTALTSDFLTDAQRQQKLDDKGILTAHREWESKYLEGSIGDKLKLDSEFVSLSNGKTGLLWSFPVPENAGGTVDRQIFLTLVKGDRVMVLNGAVTPTINGAAVRKFLLDTVQTLRTSVNPLTQEDAQKLAGKAN